MHPELRGILDCSVAHLREDPRVLAGINFGSVGQAHEDELSDVDPIFFVRDVSFLELDADLRSIFESFAPPIVLWWPESCNSETFRNYAIFLDCNGELRQYDVNIMVASAVAGDSGRWLLSQITPGQVLFDKEGLLGGPLPVELPCLYSPDNLLWSIEQYWIYVYIHAKYLLRGHAPKLAYAQGMLFAAHVEVLKGLYPDVLWTWWADVAGRFLSPEHRQALLAYYGPPDARSVGERLCSQIAQFSADARMACEHHGLPYPQDFEARVRLHLLRHALPGSNGPAARCGGSDSAGPERTMCE